MRAANGSQELREIERRYAARQHLRSDLYAVTNSENLSAQFQLERAIVDLLKAAPLTDFANLRVLEIGCGNGSNLLRLVRWGFRPANLVANELLPDRVSSARANLPAAIEVISGDARDIPGEAAFDIVYQSTVLSSLLDDDFQQDIAATMWRLVRPGGAVLSYDFAYNNPRNADVRGVPVRRLRELFPSGEFRVRKVTLAPPIARRLGRKKVGYAILNGFPFLRTHRAVLIVKPKALAQ